MPVPARAGHPEPTQRQAEAKEPEMAWGPWGSRDTPACLWWSDSTLESAGTHLTNLVPARKGRTCPHARPQATGQPELGRQGPQVSSLAVMPQ